ncbi:hypothetical protein WJU23_21735 [Prosthecobacter sp. SYSU 5D2]|uniref:hypothetical protein n=1 Tax=Prosthecobacter sp. SYSU 5D2 TaxID=3134134 RepID=UPI0031FE90C7
MKTTLEIDDVLYREAKAVAALTGRKMKDLVADGLRRVIRPTATTNAPALQADAAARLVECFALADKVMKKAPRNISGRDLLAEDRNRHLSE